MILFDRTSYISPFYPFHALMNQSPIHKIQDPRSKIHYLLPPPHPTLFLPSNQNLFCLISYPPPLGPAYPLPPVPIVARYVINSAVSLLNFASSISRSRRPARRCLMQQKVRRARLMRRTPPMAQAMPILVVEGRRWKRWVGFREGGLERSLAIVEFPLRRIYISIRFALHL